jgi:hypothetical protein
LRQYKPQGNQTFGLDEHAANGVFSFDTDYHITTDIDSVFGCYLIFMDNRILILLFFTKMDQILKIQGFQ